MLIFTAGLVAERRKARGLKLNYPESIAYISAALLSISIRSSPNVRETQRICIGH